MYSTMSVSDIPLVYDIIKKRLMIMTQSYSNNLIRYEKYSVLKEYIDKIKNKFIGEKIQSIQRLGIVFEESEGTYIVLDEPIDIKVGNNHFNICFNDETDAFCGINLFNYKEISYQDKLSWRSLNTIYKDNIIGQLIKDIILIKKDISVYEDKEYAKTLEDKFVAIHILLENNYILEITNWEDYMTVNELNGNIG